MSVLEKMTENNKFSAMNSGAPEVVIRIHNVNGVTVAEVVSDVSGGIHENLTVHVTNAKATIVKIEGDSGGCIGGGWSSMIPK